jgi:DsbC/DsbD-like thiol-disulfide interchange protein
MSFKARLGQGWKPSHKFRSVGAFLLAPLLAVCAAPAGGLAATGPHGTVDLLAEPTSVQPARPFWVGVYFQLEPGWHIYWINPGDSGEPPRIKWNLPSGFQAGPVLWPRPSRIEDHSLIDYGYRDKTMLPAEITPPANASAGSDIQLNVTVNWLVCREMCIPGWAALELTLPIRNGAPGAPSPQHALFAEARADLPTSAPRGWEVTASLEAHAFVLNVETGKRETAATFFPLQPNQIENAAPQKTVPGPRGIRLELARSDQMLKPSARLSGVLELGSRRAYVIDAPVAGSK